MTLIIAIDGPSGSGKSSTSRGVAERLGLSYLDTGAMYRAMTWALLQRGVDVSDPGQVADACLDVSVQSGTDPQAPTIVADGVELGEHIRADEVTAAVSAVSAVVTVRERLVELQRHVIAHSDGIVVEGRDIGSVVAPHANLKVYLVADASARAQRRAAENGEIDAAVTSEQLAARDQRDSSREASPLEMPADATLVNNTHLSLAEVIEHISALAQETV